MTWEMWKSKHWFLHFGESLDYTLAVADGEALTLALGNTLDDDLGDVEVEALVLAFWRIT